MVFEPKTDSEKINDAKKEETLTSFIIKSINHDSCTETGKFTIIGDVSQELSQPLIFTISSISSPISPETNISILHFSINSL